MLMMLALRAREIRPVIRLNCCSCFVSQAGESERESWKDIPADADDPVRSRNPSRNSRELLRLLRFPILEIGEREFERHSS